MALSLLGLFIAFFAVISFYRKRHDRLQQETDDNFWEREQQANFVRRKDISGLPYISIPFDSFSIGAFSDTQLSELETTLDSFREKKILNLTGQSNTDLKLLYGPANLTALTEYDQNFTDMLQSFTKYVNRLIELNHLEAAIPILEFCIETGSDISVHYTILADYYSKNGSTHKIDELREKASALNSLTKTSILQKLDAIASSHTEQSACQ
ncbi:MAG: hypothetical protein IKU69_05945 [Roseburia sp.]|nr:hypothetical protein [Roseburia sp.]